MSSIVVPQPWEYPSFKLPRWARPWERSKEDIVREAVTTVGTPTTTTYTGTSGSITYPTGIQSNDLLLFGLSANGTTQTLTPPTGFTLYHRNSYNNLLLCYKVAAGTESGSAAFSWSATATGSAGMICLRGADSTSPMVAVSADGQGTGPTSHTVPSVSWAGAKDVVSVILFGFQSTSTTVTFPTGWNYTTDGFNAMNFQAVYLGCNLTTQSGVTTLASKTCSTTASEDGCTNQYAILVGAGGGGGGGRPRQIISSKEAHRRSTRW